MEEAAIDPYTKKGLDVGNVVDVTDLQLSQTVGSAGSV